MQFFRLFSKNVNQDTLIDDLLNHHDIKLRMKSAKLLSKNIDPKSAEALLQSIRDDCLSPFFAKKYKTVLRSQKEEEQIMGRGEYMPLVKTVALALLKLGIIAENALIEAVQDKSLRVRAVATRVLQEEWSPKSHDTLKMIYENNHEEVLIRFVAANKLYRKAINNVDESGIIYDYLLDKSASMLAKLHLKSGLRSIELCDFAPIEQIIHGLTAKKLDDVIKSMQSARLID